MLGNLLVLSAGRKYNLVRRLREAWSRRDAKVFATDVSALSSGLHAADDYFISPTMTDKKQWADTVSAWCRAHDVKFVLPTRDGEMIPLAEMGAWYQWADIELLGPSLSVANFAIRKDDFARAMCAAGIPHPKTELFRNEDHLDRLAFPVFIKPNFGAGGHCAVMCRTRADAKFYCSQCVGAIVQEFIEGPEYTVDCFCDRQCNLVQAVVRHRIQIRAGQIDVGQVVRVPEAVETVKKVLAMLPIAGPCNIQMIERAGVFYVIEMNPRFSGGIELTIQAGANFCEYLAQMLAGERIVPGEITKTILLGWDSGVFLPGEWFEAEVGGRKE